MIETSFCSGLTQRVDEQRLTEILIVILFFSDAAGKAHEK